MIIRLDSFSEQILNIVVYFVLYQSLDDRNVKICKFTALSSGSFCQIYRVTDEALIAKPRYGPTSFLCMFSLLLKDLNLLLLYILFTFSTILILLQCVIKPAPGRCNYLQCSNMYPWDNGTYVIVQTYMLREN